MTLVLNQLTPHLQAEIRRTFYMEQQGSADFELLVVDHNVELAGVDACVRLLDFGDQQASVVPLDRAPPARLKPVGRRILPGKKAGRQNKALSVTYNW